MIATSTCTKLTLYQNYLKKIDNVICAEIPDASVDNGLHKVVTDTLIHGPCGTLISNSLDAFDRSLQDFRGKILAFGKALGKKKKHLELILFAVDLRQTLVVIHRSLPADEICLSEVLYLVTTRRDVAINYNYACPAAKRLMS